MRLKSTTSSATNVRRMLKHVLGLIESWRAISTERSGVPTWLRCRKIRIALDTGLTRTAPLAFCCSPRSKISLLFIRSLTHARFRSAFYTENKTPQLIQHTDAKQIGRAHV